MKIICINNKNHENNLTINKIYELDDKFFLDDNNFWRYIKLTNDVGDANYYPKILFKPLNEYRNEQIDNILK